MDFYLENAAELSTDVGYVKFPAKFYTQITSTLDERQGRHDLYWQDRPVPAQPWSSSSQRPSDGKHVGSN